MVTGLLAEMLAMLRKDSRQPPSGNLVGSRFLGFLERGAGEEVHPAGRLGQRSAFEDCWIYRDDAETWTCGLHIKGVTSSMIFRGENVPLIYFSPGESTVSSRYQPLPNRVLSKGGK